MGKIGQVMVVVAMVAVCYIIMLVVMPVVVGLANAANVTMQASANMSTMPGSVDFMVSIPWILWFCPASIGIIIVVMILRQP